MTTFTPASLLRPLATLAVAGALSPTAIIQAQRVFSNISRDGSQQMHKLLGSSVDGLPEVNVNFFMLTPSGKVTLTATRAGNKTGIHFQTMSGFTYQV